MFNLAFPSSQTIGPVPEISIDGPMPNDGDVDGAPQQKAGTNRRSRRRRNARKTRVEPMVKTTTTTPTNKSRSRKSGRGTTSKRHDAPMTKNDLYFALDCEMVGIGPDGFDSAVARVTVINWEHKVVLDSFVKVPAQVTNYRTHVSGIRPQDIEGDAAITFEQARDAVERILRGKILIGHGLENDLCALGLTHPWCDVRDTARYAPYMKQVVGDDKLLLRPRKLRDLAWEMLGTQIQDDCKPHCPVEDAAAALDLYKEVRADWEEKLRVEQANNFQEQQKSTTTTTSSPVPIPDYTSPQKHAPYQHPVDPRLFNGPYGSQIPGFSPAPLPPPYPTAIESNTKPSSYTRRWFSSRAKSPERSAIKEDQEYQPTSRPMSPRTMGLFSFRRSSATRRGALQAVLSAETVDTTEAFETESNGWSPSNYAGSQTGTDDYTSLADWSHTTEQQQQLDYWQHGDQPSVASSYEGQHYSNTAAILHEQQKQNSPPLRSRLSTYLSNTSQEAIAGGDEEELPKEQYPQEWQAPVAYTYAGEWSHNFQIPNLRS